MAILSAPTLVRLISVFHLTIAYYLLTSPRTLIDQNLVYILGEAMGLPQTNAFNKANPVTGLLALMFAYIGIADFTAASMREELSVAYWSNQTPVRIVFLFVLTGYTYLFKRGGALSAKGLAYKAGVGENLKNGVVFAWGFVEISAWFWVYVTLKEDRRQAAIRVAERRKREEDML